MKQLVIYCGLFILMLSCKKEEPVTETQVPVEDCPECVESFVEEFSDYETLINVTITGHAYCGISSINQFYYFRMEPYMEVDGKFFYQRKKKSVFKYTNDPHEIDWTPTEGYFRYDYDAKIAYQYASLDDTDPIVLMDFNQDVGDSILIDNSTDMGPIYLVITDVSNEVIGGIPYPRMEAYLGEDVNNTCVLSPYYPNPLIVDYEEFESYLWNDWDESNLSDYYSYVEVLPNYFSFVLTEMSTEEIVSSSTLSYSY